MECGKKSYPSFRAAQEVINLARKRHWGSHRSRGTSKPTRSYKCPACGQYHLTSLKSGQIRGRERSRKKSYEIEES